MLDIFDQMNQADYGSHSYIRAAVRLLSNNVSRFSLPSLPSSEFWTLCMLSVLNGSDKFEETKYKISQDRHTVHGHVYGAV